MTMTTTPTFPRTTVRPDHPVEAEEAKARSLALAAARGHTACSHAARTRGWSLNETTGELVSLALEIASATSERVYAIGYLAATDDAICECAAAQHGSPCWHCGLALLVGRAVERLYAPAGREAAERDAYLAWINEPPSAEV